MTEKKFDISGMSCGHCVKAVEKELSMLNVDFYEVEIGLAKVKYDESKLDENKIEHAIEEAGYEVTSKQ